MKLQELLQKTFRIGFLAALVIPLSSSYFLDASNAMELHKKPSDFRTLDLLLWDKESDVKLAILYGRMLSGEQGVVLEIFGREDSVRAAFVKLSPQEVEKMHALVCKVINEFSFGDVVDEKEFERRKRAGIRKTFTMTLDTIEQGVNLSIDPDDVENFKNVKELFIMLIKKFPKEWRAKVRWAK